ncbi:MAG TPA: sulfite exporter TauE/SafE family protein [Tepidisphaeraceae bacterium]
MDWITLHVLVVVFVATLIRSTLGFGEALVAVPLLALRLPVQVAAPLAVLVSITVAAIVMAQEWHRVHFRAAGWLAAWTMLGIPLGLLMLKEVNGRTVKATLGLVIIAFALWSLLNRVPFTLNRDRHKWLFGFGLFAGVLGGAYGMNGPPLVVYGSLRRWSAAQFRATLQGYFLPASLAGMFGYWVAGLWVPAVTRFYLLSLPATIVATFLGRVLHARISPRAFFAYVYLGLLAIGLVLLAQAFGAQ